MSAYSCNNINPFFSEWENEYGIPQFDKIRDKDYIRAVKFGIHQHSAEIDAIIATDAEPTFENTVAAYENSGAILDRVCAVLFNIAETDATPSIRKITDKAMQLLTEHNDNVFMNPYFYERVKHVYDNRETAGLDREQVMLVEKLCRQFVANGVALDPDGQKRMREINAELASLEQKFGNNLLEETNAFILELSDSAEVTGLPESVLRAAAADAQSCGSSAKWVFTLQNPSYVPFMTYSSRRDLREKMFRAYSSRGNNGNDNDNNDVVLRIMELRIEKAALLGYETPAEFILSDKMAGTPANVDSFLSELFAAAVAKAGQEVADMQVLMDDDVKAGILPDDSTSVIEPWDWAYYAEKVRQSKFALDEAEIKPYFKMENVREGVFSTASRLYGLKFEKLSGIPVYNDEVEGFKISDSDGSLIGILLTDYYPRSTKRGGAWMSNFVNQYVAADGREVRPVIVNVGNFTKPTPGQPSLLTLDEVKTMFHEFGHALHGLLSQCRYKDVSGTSVARDFVELPSQINENWALQPEVLATYARHYETGEVIPDSLVRKIRNAETFNQGFMTTELVAASILDMRWHELTSVFVPADSRFASDREAPAGAEAATLVAGGRKIPAGSEGGLRYVDPVKFEKAVMEDAGLIKEIIPRYRTTYFNHIFKNGYNAGYYSYLWAEVLDKDAFELFLEKGIFDRNTAMSFRRNILEKGGSEDPMVLYRRFRGADPNPEAMMKARGL